MVGCGYSRRRDRQREAGLSTVEKRTCRAQKKNGRGHHAKTKGEGDRVQGEMLSEEGGSSRGDQTLLTNEGGER